MNITKHLKSFGLIASLSFFLIFGLVSCGTCIGCNGKLFDLNAAENYKKRVVQEKKSELRKCYEMGFERGTSGLITCLDRFDRTRKIREDKDLARSRAIGNAFGEMGEYLLREPVKQPTVSPPDPDRQLNCTPYNYGPHNQGFHCR